MAGWRVGIDIGGTFTDIVAVHDGSETPRSAKVPSRAADPVGSITAALGAVGLRPDEVQELIHGTTRVTNAIVEGRLEPVALIATEGFEDIIEIGRQSRRDLYRLDVPPKPAPLVPRERRIAAGGRMLHDGTELAPLAPGQAKEAAERAVASGARSVAIALLHAYANPAHEEAIAERLKGRVPYLSLSHVINPEAREYERTIATVLNAAVMPLAAEYLAKLRATLPAETRLSVMHSAGGMASPEAASERPLVMALSGPAAGVAAAAAVARDVGEQAVLSFDMGGTTTDVALILDGQAEITADAKLADQPLRQPMVAIESIGAGGGSIVRHGPGGLSIGPQSAGAEPGPACYGRGGAQPTVCDANAILGYLNPRRKLGGEITLDRAKAEAVFAPLAATLGVPVVELALGVLRVADATMARALNKITVERGVDGRGATLLAFGGMGPMHAVGLARSYGMSRVLVPAFSSAFSALGCVAAETSYTRQRTLRLPGDSFDTFRLASVRQALAEELQAPLLEQGHAPEALVVEETALIRYRGQSYAVDVAMTGIGTAEDLAAAFEARHEALFGFASGEAWELLGLRVRVRAPRKARIPGAPASAAPARPFATDPCWFAPGEPVPTPRYDRAVLSLGDVIHGPAIVEDDWSTTVIPPGWQAAPDERGNILLTEEAA
ncbi:hydantoinase/oxoprolinase family protein [Neoroseomonas soli]|uniref:Hydantoinase/oxoprolinase family protein n=1 Tax=Neoroseomonas soli TaxID=1081025 RepID=A0A9X9WR30_9PROT|nr:hydantoinase/oxoprolinase family protein [Neoroseomonas soli]MBR0669609.1 hydantoinase/oxoprolinase family protein [Neoroseomonas soli]